MNDILSLMLPEVILLIGAAAVLLIGVTRHDALRGLASPVAVLTVFVALVTAWYNVPLTPAEPLAGLRFSNLAWYVRLIGLGIGLLVLLLHLHLPAQGERGEIFGMILFSLAGILLTSLADDLVVLFLAIELVSIPTYVLVSISRSDIRAQEAGVKYFFLGAMSAALLVYGFSFLYGASGTTVMSQMALSPPGALATVGLLLAFAGVAYKIAAVPFHVYAPDVYQGAASPVTGLLGFFPKLAGFVALIKLLLLIQPTGGAASGWQLPTSGFIFLWVVSALTMTVGNVIGLMQHNVKRMLAYSSIAHSGYMLIGILVGPVAGAVPLSDGVSAALFYIVAYGVMNLGAFAVLSVIESRGRPAETLTDLSGLARRQPAAALAMAICVFSLMGLPPTAGFFGKVYVIMSALSAGAGDPHRSALIWLAVIGVLNSAVAAAYYLRIIGACYVSEEDAGTVMIPRSLGARISIGACAALVLIIGFWPQGLLRMARWPVSDLQPPRAVVAAPDATSLSAAPQGRSPECAARFTVTAAIPEPRSAAARAAILPARRQN